MADRQDNLAKPNSTADDGPAPLAPPCAVVIFGAAGDLTKRLVVPALYNLVEDKRLPDGFQLVGVDLAAKSTEEWRQGLTEMMNEFVTVGGGEFSADHIFGEMALIDNEPRSATAIAVTDVELVAVTEKQFLFLVGQTPYFALKVMRVLAQRLRVTNKTFG